MEEKRIIKLTIEHWERMIKWASRRVFHLLCKPNSNVMLKKLGEIYRGEDCPLCKEYYKEYHSFNGCSNNCPMIKIDKCCNTYNSLWRKVNDSKTWWGWIIMAKKLVRKLKEYEEKM